MLLKTAVCISGILALLFVAFTYKNYRLKEGNAPYVHVKEVLPFMETLTEVNKGIISQEMQNELLGLQNRFMMQQNEEESYLLFGELQTILQAFPIESVDWLTEYKGESWYVGLRDWNCVAELLTQNYGNGRIVLQELSLLGMSEQISDEEHNTIAENMVFTGKNLLHNQYPCIGDYLFSNVNAICFEDSILSITGHAKEKGILENVYFSDISEDRVHLFYNGYHMYYPVDTFNNISGKYENGKNLRKIIDIELEKGSMNVVHEKEDYIHGKLLQVSDSTIEIEGYGKYQTDENMQVYKEYGELESVNRNDLRIGYPFSDFVVEDGKIVACLVIKDEDMEYIRVLLKNSDMAGRYHENVSGYCNRDMEWIEYEEGVEKERRVIPKGENFNIDRKDIKRSGKRIKLIPSVLSGEITLESVNRSNGNPSYLGSLEITGDEEGLLVINEVLLEDYLCKVVPSEMPSSYPKEALMAQAVCARTYAYGKMMNAGLPEFGAHVDDSAGFQVYNNIAEQTSTTEAVKATHNIIAQYNGEPIGAYYYSTSCGMGSDTGVWHGASVSPGYLQAKEIGIQQDVDGVLFSDAEFTPQSLMDEEVFEKWITDVKDSHYESQEGWYRWSYDVKKIDVSHMEEVLQSRFLNNPNMILTLEDGDFKSREIESLGEIKNIQIVKRLPGGVADELIITGTEATVKVLSELNIRYVLADGKTKVIRQTADEVDAATLPSAFIAIELMTEDETVTGYTINGGGFGHGVGMSQNGAKNMAQTGLTCEEILTFFYPGVDLKKLHEEEIS